MFLTSIFLSLLFDTTSNDSFMISSSPTETFVLFLSIRSDNEYSAELLTLSLTLNILLNILLSDDVIDLFNIQV